MSLFKQIVMIMSLFFVLILIVNFRSATGLIQNQFDNNAKNTARSLAISLSKVTDLSEISTMKTIVNTVYDSGNYPQIRLVDAEGKELYSRKTDFCSSDVPQWFVEMVSLHTASASNDIMKGSSRFGRLEVHYFAPSAYHSLYSTLRYTVQLFLVIVFTLLLTLFALLFVNLKSLKRIQEQAEGIIDNEFIIEKNVPITTEFRSAMRAMNTMVEKVKEIFERENDTLRRYHELLYKDSESKLHNRRYLTAKLPDYLQSDSSLSSGVYVMVSLNEIDRLKRQNGYERYSILIGALSEALNKHLGSFRHALIARLNESDFFAVLPACEINEISHQIEHITAHMHEVIEEMDSHLFEYLVIGCGIGTYSENDTLKSLFSRADHTVSQSKLCRKFVVDSKESDASLVLGREEWRDELLKSLNESRMLLAFQSVVEQRIDTLNVIHEEIFLRLLDKEGAIHSAGYFIPIATNLGLVDTLDRYMIEKVFKHIQEHNPLTPLALNLSSDFVKNHANIQWLREQLESFHRNNDLVLWFEVSNTTALHDLNAVATISAMVKMFGYYFGIDHFALPEAGAHYLQAIRPDYVKSNSAYLQDMMLDQSSGKSRDSFNKIIRSLGISIIAINIEDALDIERVKMLGIERFQGSYIAPVALLQ